MKASNRSFRFILPLGVALVAVACGGGTPESTTPATPATPAAPAAPEAAAPEAAAAATPSYPAGFITSADITLGDKLDEGMITEAKKIFDAKCHVCHSMTDQKVVGPGWKGVINERKPEWIMNMMLHTQWMVENDPDAQALVEETKTVMPDQQLTKEQARAMLELIRSLK
ncbi:MAG: c-type cytochrome [Flavobacteriales bacterium]|nr:cytochrome c [Flavobacteriales bacterium]MCL4281011.1 c-type cytochrome [Flavobacteriales bacterium]